jgi:MFS family permease
VTLLRDRAFALYLAGQTASGAGAALSGVALVFAVLSVSGSPASVGLVLLAGRLPGLVLTLTGGVLADRWSRQRIAVCADVARTALQTLTGALLLTGRATIPALATLQVLAGGASAIFAPAAGALAAAVAPGGQIRRANSLLSMTAAIAQTGGLALAGLIVAVAGPGTSFLIDGATFAVSSVTLALIPPAPMAPPRRTTLRRDLREGCRVVAGRAWLVAYAAHETALNVLALGPFFVLGPVVAQEDLGGAPAWSAIALGYVLGNLAAAHVTYHWAPRRPVLSAVTVSAGLAPLPALLALHAPVGLIAAAAVLAGAQSTIYNTLFTATLQSNLPGGTLGRASAITGLGSAVLVPVGMGLAGVLAGAVGAPTVLLAGAGVVVAATALCAALPATRAPLELR